MSHFAEQVRLYGSLPQWSAETHEHAHRANLKDGWNASNKNLDYLPQIIAYHRRVLCILEFYRCVLFGESHARHTPPG